MKFIFTLSVFFILLFAIIGCQKNKIIENQFSSLSDTIFIKTKIIKGNGLFDLGFGHPKFKDTLNTFSNSIVYPKGIKNLKRFQLKTDFKEKKDYNVEILLGNKNNKQVFLLCDFLDKWVIYYTLNLGHILVYYELHVQF